MNFLFLQTVRIVLQAFCCVAEMPKITTYRGANLLNRVVQLPAYPFSPLIKELRRLRSKNLLHVKLVGDWNVLPRKTCTSMG
jgi:hypothetical protein